MQIDNLNAVRAQVPEQLSEHDWKQKRKCHSAHERTRQCERKTDSELNSQKSQVRGSGFENDVLSRVQEENPVAVRLQVPGQVLDNRYDASTLFMPGNDQ
jgi:hypothetical protein